MQVLRTVEVAVVIVGHVHVFQFMSGQDFLLQQCADKSISESCQCLCDMLCNLKIDDCNFPAFGTLVDPREIVNACYFKRKLKQDTVDLLLELCEEIRQFLSCGIVPQDEFEECQMRQFVVVFAEEVRRRKLRVGMKPLANLLLYLRDGLAMMGKPKRERGEMGKKRPFFYDVFVLVCHLLFFYKQSKDNLT